MYEQSTQEESLQNAYNVTADIDVSGSLTLKAMSKALSNTVGLSL